MEEEGRTEEAVSASCPFPSGRAKLSRHPLRPGRPRLGAVAKGVTRSPRRGQVWRGPAAGPASAVWEARGPADRGVGSARPVLPPRGSCSCQSAVGGSCGRSLGLPPTPADPPAEACFGNTGRSCFLMGRPTSTLHCCSDPQLGVQTGARAHTCTHKHMYAHMQMCTDTHMCRHARACLQQGCHQSAPGWGRGAVWRALFWSQAPELVSGPNCSSRPDGTAVGTVRPSLSTSVPDGGIAATGVGRGWGPAAWRSLERGQTEARAPPLVPCPVKGVASRCVLPDERGLRVKLCRGVCLGEPQAQGGSRAASHWEDGGGAGVFGSLQKLYLRCQCLCYGRLLNAHLGARGSPCRSFSDGGSASSGF